MAPDVALRPWEPGDAAGERRVVADAFGDHGAVVADLVDALRASGHARAAVVAETVSEAGRQVVGAVLLSRSWLDARERLVEVAVLSPLAVDPAHQGRGTGTALLAAAVEAARGSTCRRWCSRAPRTSTARGGSPGRATHGIGAPSVRIPDAAFQVGAARGPRALDAGAGGLLRPVLGARLRRPARPPAGPVRGQRGRQGLIERVFD